METSNKLKILTIIISLIFIAYFASGQFSNIRNKAGNKKIINMSFSLNNATKSKASYSVFFQSLCKVFENSDKPIQLIVRNKPRSELSFIKCDYEFQNLELESEAIMTKDGFVIDGIKLAKGSKVQLQNNGSTFIAYLQSIKTNTEL